MKALKNNFIYGLVIFYVLALLYAFLISGKEAAGFKVFDLIFLNINSFSDYYLSKFDVVLYLLFILFLLIYAYYPNKNIFDDKSFYTMTINRYATKKKALIAHISAVLKISLYLSIANMLITTMISLGLALGLDELLKVWLFLFKLALMSSALSVGLHWSLIDLKARQNDYSIYLYMVILLGADYFLNTNFLMYSGKLFEEVLYLLVAILAIIVQCLLLKLKGASDDRTN